MPDFLTYEHHGSGVYDIIARCGTYDYSWNEEAILRRQSDGALFYTEDCGCSCYGFGDHGDLDLEPVRSIEEALRKSDHRDKLAESLRLNGAEVDT